MPYIKSDDRMKYDWIEEVIDDLRRESRDGTFIDGHLNYIITRIVLGALGPKEGEGDWSYLNIARATAAFECAKLEFYRRIGATKEDKVIISNGDIPEYEIKHE